MAVKNLELRARVIVEGFWNGLHRSPYHGFSVEFSEYRQYTTGDDTRYLDWKLFARSDRYYIKKFEDETNLRCYFLFDNSRSMRYGSLSYTKAEYAATLAASLAYFLHKQGDAFGLLTFDEAVRDYLPARHRPGHLRQFMHALEKPAEGVATDFETPLRRVMELVKKRGVVVFLSDLMAPIDRLQSHLAPLTAMGHEVIVFQVLDPAEINFTFTNALLFQDVESGREVYIDPAAARKGYLEKFEAHQAEAQAVCRRLGAQFQTLPTDRPLEQAMFDFLRARMQRAKTIIRKTRTQG